MRNKRDKIYEAIANPKTKLVSFDIFDTLLLRPFWVPTDLFLFLDREASKLLGNPDVIDFSACRCEAEQRARVEAAKAGREDVTLREIYAQIEKTDLFPAEVSQALFKKEMELELRFCSARKSARELLNFAFAQGKRVVAISDMYLPSALISEMLRKNGMEGLERIFVSCEAGVSKCSGHLFEYALRELNLDATAMVHIGDNLKSDVKIPEKMGIRAFAYYRTTGLLEGSVRGVSGGTAFKRAYTQLRCTQPGFYAIRFLGLRCMLAVAANRIYDDPFRTDGCSGVYAKDPELFGNLALGMYCTAHAMWIDQLACESKYDRVLFFSRDGYLPYLGFQMIQQYREKRTEAVYARISRKALLPLVLSDERWGLYAGSQVVFYLHTPESLTRTLSPVLQDDAEKALAQIKGEAWDKAFASETEMLSFLKLLREQYIEPIKLENTRKGFQQYFSPLMKGKVLTCDVGYSLRNETVLHNFFPESKITACFTHIHDDISLRRANQGQISLRLFYPYTPYVSWLPRELFLSETHASCTGYTTEGEPIFSSDSDGNALLKEMQEHAAAYMEAFSSSFREDLAWLPLQYADACLPFETFLHSPLATEKRWLQNLNSDNEAGDGVHDTEVLQFWRVLRTDYWIARHHLGKWGRHIARFLMLSIYDRQELKERIQSRLERH